MPRSPHRRGRGAWERGTAKRKRNRKRNKKKKRHMTSTSCLSREVCGGAASNRHRARHITAAPKPVRGISQPAEKPAHAHQRQRQHYNEKKMNASRADPPAYPTTRPRHITAETNRHLPRATTTAATPTTNNDNKPEQQQTNKRGILQPRYATIKNKQNNTYCGILQPIYATIKKTKQHIYCGILQPG